jgi:hypothetical protein
MCSSSATTCLQQHRRQVLSRYRELLRLIERLPQPKAAAARQEASASLRRNQREADPQAQLQQLKQLVARISFLRITTPRPPGEALGGGTYVLRDGQLVQGGGQDKGTRCAACVCAGCQLCGS